MTAPLVRFDAVQKTYDGVTRVVRDLSMDIARGEFLTLLGPSGSGKTTTLMMLAGFEAPTSGEIFLEGKPITRLPPHKRGIGVVFQNYALFPHMTVAANVAFPLEVRGLAREDVRQRVTKALDMVRLAAFGGRRPAQLSGGQQQRVALARALVFEPRLVLMDEPLGALDKQLREHMQDEIRHLHKQLGVTVVYVTHDQSEALALSDRIAVFAEGVVQQLATPDVLYERPANAFVAGFIGESNRIRGRVRAIDGTVATVEALEGGAIRALAGPGLRAGEDAVVSLRPEKLHLGAAAAGLANVAEAAVLDRVYHGDHIRLVLAAWGSADISARLAGAAGPVGDRIAIGFSAEDAVALPLAEGVPATPAPE
jgi:putative spermidine/putrescine transport system ATP-binding protein